MSHRDPSATSEDRLIFLADALTMVPFSEATLRRAIATGELKAWQPNRDGKLVIWRSTLIEWATRRPATDSEPPEARRDRRPSRPSSRARRRATGQTQTPDPITLPDIA